MGGNATVSDFGVEQMSSLVFPTLAGLDDVLNMDADALLQQGRFSVPTAAGVFTIAGGMLRLTNFYC